MVLKKHINNKQNFILVFINKFFLTPFFHSKDKKPLFILLTILVALPCIWIIFFSGSNIEDPEKIARKKGKQLLRLWSITAGESRAITVTQKINKQLEETFFRRNPDIMRVNTTKLQVPESAREGTLLMALAGGSAPDVLIYFIYQAQTLMEQGFLEPLEKYIDDEKKKNPDFEDQILIPEKLKPVITRFNPESKRDERHGLVLKTTYKTLIYHKDLFIEAGLDPNKPPKTWDELFEYAVKLTRPDKVVAGARGKLGQFGIADAHKMLSNFYTFLYFQTGYDLVKQIKFCPHHKGEVSLSKEKSFHQCPQCKGDLKDVSVKWKVNWASKGGVQALEYMKKLKWTPWIRVEIPSGKEKEYYFTNEQFDKREKVVMKDGTVFDLNNDSTRNKVKFGCMFVPTENIRYVDMIRMFANGQIAMMTIPLLEENLANMEREGVNFDGIKIAMIPSGPNNLPVTHMGATMFGINSQSSEKSKQAAWEYIKFITGEEAWQEKTKIYVENGMYHVVRPDFLKRFNYEEFYNRVDPSIIKLYSDFKDYARAMPWNEGWMPSWSSFLPEAIDAVLKIDNGYDQDSLGLLQKAQDLANKTALKIKDEKKYSKIRKPAYLIFIVVLILFIWAISYISRSKLKDKNQVAEIDIVGTKTSRAMIRRTIYAWLFLLPAVISVILWKYYPLAHGGGMAFFDYKLLKGFGSKFVGIDNFIDIFRQPMFYKVFINTLFYVGLTIGFGFIVPIVLAFLLEEVPKGSLFFRIVFYLPAMMTPLVTLLLWRLLYDPTQFGLLNKILIYLEWVDPQNPLKFLGDPKMAMICIIIPGIWAHAGPGSIIYLAALKVVPEDLYEAIMIDGGSIWDKLRYVTLPSLAPLIIINFIGSFIAAWQAMQNIFVMTGGGPLNATRVMGIEIWYNAFVYLRFGYSTALSWILASLLIGFTVFQIKMFNKVEFKSAQAN